MTTPVAPSARLCAAVAVCLVTSACRQASLPEPRFSVRAADTCPADDGERFFPPTSFASARQPASAPQLRAYASLVLARLGEPSLSCDAIDESYRLLWLHSFSNLPRTAVRLHRADGA